MTRRTYCSAANPGEPMLGTADVVDVWLLLEYRPLWKAKAVVDNDLSDRVRQWFSDGVAALREDGFKVRPQLIRQPESDRSNARLLVHHAGVLREFDSGAAGYGSLPQIPIEALVRDHALGTTIEAPRYFVCTNGQRDLCCARFGLPAYMRLRELVGERAWQTTHLGGHRFAPNVLVLPSGMLYGRIRSDDAEAFVSQIESGQILAAKLRGRSCYSQPVQAAEGLIGRAGLKLLGVVDDEVAATVTFAGSSDTLTVTVRKASEPIWVTASCADEKPKAVHPYVAAVDPIKN